MYKYIHYFKIVQKAALKTNNKK